MKRLALAGCLLMIGSAAWSARALVARGGKNQVVAEGARVDLDGSGTAAPESSSLRYAWRVVSGPPVDITDSKKPRAFFTAPILSGNLPRLIAIELSVTAAVDQTDRDLVYVIVTNQNGAPTADAGAEQTVDRDSLVVLEGTNSTDPDGDDLDFAWRQLAGPKVVLGRPLSREAVFVPPTLTGRDAYPRRFEFELTVDDRHGGVSTATVTMNVTENQKIWMEDLQGGGWEKQRKSDMEMDLETSRARELSRRLDAIIDEERKKADGYAEERNIPALRASVEKILMLNPMHPDAPRLLRAASDGVRRPVEAAVEAAVRRFIDRDYFGMLRELQAAREADPSNAVIHELGAMAVQALEAQANNDFLAEGVRTAKKHEQEQNTKHSRTLYSQGLLLYSQGRLREAAQVFRRAVDFDRTNALAASAYQRVGNELKGLR